MIVVGLLGLGNVGPALLDTVATSVREAFTADIVRLKEGPDPRYAWDDHRGQHNSEIILRRLLAEAPPDVDRVLGVTSVDLFIPMLSFVFGQAQLNGKAAVVSSARLDPTFHGFPVNPALTAARLSREAVHELGHTLGLTHCIVRACPMSLATTIAQLDAKSPELCEGCRSVLKEKINRGLLFLSES